MKIGRWICSMIICFLSITMLTSCVDDKHITQKDAQKIANELLGEEVTYVETQETSDAVIYYVFTDSKGNTFSIISVLAEPSIDGATIEGFPRENIVNDDYHKAVITCNEEEILKILEKYGLDGYLESDLSVRDDIDLEVYTGTPEENQEIVNNFVAAAVEIDTLLSITYDKDYRQKTKYSYDSYSFASMRLTFNKILEGKDIPEICVDIASFDFSLSEDTRWTVDSLYEHVVTKLEKVELAE